MSNLTPVIKSIQDIMRQDSGVDGDAQRISQLTWLLFLKVFDALEEELELTRDAYKSPIPEHLRWRNWAADPEGITGDELLDFVNNELFPSSRTCRPTRCATRAAMWCAACSKTPTTT
jgi:type I restriction enzyme M protein